MTTSVAMCTYNGAQFIEEQIRSILNQTVPVGEIVVCDDGSTDSTIEIIQKIAKETTIPIHIHINETNLGCVRNFEKAIHLCNGDIIFLSDQDDIWMPNKVEKIVDYFLVNRQISVIISDALLIENNGKPIPNITLFDVVGLKDQLKYFDKGFAMELFLQVNRATGCTMALRKDFVSLIYINSEAKPGTDKQIHDGCIAISAIIKNALGYIKEPLTLYRQHISQVCGLKEYIDNPICFPSPLIPLGYVNLSYGITHKRMDMQLLRMHYTRKEGVLLHYKDYYESYGKKLMWAVMINDIYLRLVWFSRRFINLMKKCSKKILPRA